MKKASFHFFAGERWRKFIPAVLVACSIAAGVVAGIIDFKSSYRDPPYPHPYVEEAGLFLAIYRVTWFILGTLLGYKSMWVETLKNMYLFLFCIFYALVFAVVVMAGYKVYMVLKTQSLLIKYLSGDLLDASRKMVISKQNAQEKCMRVFYAIRAADKRLLDAVIEHQEFVAHMQSELCYREGQKVYGINGRKLKDLYKRALHIARDEEALIRVWSGRHISDNDLLKTKWGSLYSSALRSTNIDVDNNCLKTLNNANMYITEKTVYSLLARAKYDEEDGTLVIESRQHHSS